MVWRIDDPQGGEADKVKYEIVEYTRGKGVDLGCGPKKVYPHFIGVDSCKDTELFGIQMKPDVVCEDASNLDFIDDGSLDFIFSSHLLEHIEDTRAALSNWWTKIKAGGHLVLYLPHRDLYPRIGTFGSNPDHKHDFCNEDIHDHMVNVALEAGTGWDLRVNEKRDQGMEYSFLMVFQKTGQTDVFWHSWDQPRPAKTACVVRYGGFGDMIQASNILPELSRQGYHVTVMTTPRARDILAYDPHVDRFFLQDNDQVPNHELSAFWAVQEKKFDRFINLSESVEGTLLALPGRTNHKWPDNLRRRELGKNYLEFTAALAELPYRSEARFYPTEQETARAVNMLRGLRRKLGGLGILSKPRFNILWCLSGSSRHKFYPHQDIVIGNVLKAMPEAVVILNGDMACKILEAGWEKTARVICTSGEMEIRDSLTLAQQVQCVVGPETGTLNAVAFEPVPKVILLSHSSRENLTKHWVNTTTLAPADTSCYPCHRLHYTMDYCREHPETGAAMCQFDIAGERVFEGIAAAYSAWKRAKALTGEPA